MDPFRFLNPELQAALRRLYDAAGIPCEQGPDGSLACEESFEAAAEALRSAVRCRRFPDWHTQCLSEGPSAEDAAYRKAALQHLAERAIPHELELHGAETWVLLPEDEALPDTLWASIYGPVTELVPTRPACCFCGEALEGDGFGQISVHHAGSGFSSVLYAHLPCLQSRVTPAALHILETTE
jgi:hypothetical protein